VRERLKIVNRGVWTGSVLVVWAVSVGAVCYYSLIPHLELPVDFWNADKLYHFAAYAWLATLPMVGLRTRKVAVAAALSMLILGMLLEAGQSYLPGRIASFIDALANSLGVLVGLVGGNSLRPRLRGILLPVDCQKATRR